MDDALARLLTGYPPVGESSGPEATVERVLDAALEEFVEVGLRRATVGAIAGRAGVAPATIYRRIGQRDALVTAVIAREVMRGLAATATAFAAAEDPTEKVVEGFATAVEFLNGHPLLARTVEFEVDMVARLFTADAEVLLGLARAAVTDELARLGEAAGVSVRDPGAATEVLVRFGHSLALTPSRDLLADAGSARTFARKVFVPMVFDSE